MADKSEDILADALEFMGESVINNEYVQYGPLRLAVAPKVREHSTVRKENLTLMLSGFDRKERYGSIN